MDVKEERSISPSSQFSDGATNGKESPSSGPIRRKVGDDSSTSTARQNASSSSTSKNPIAAPVKSACTFCRSRKSRCNGKQPCAACINRGRTDDCVYTISRRGGKPKPKSDKIEPLEMHLEKLLGLSELPHLVRIPNAMPQLQSFQQDQGNDFDYSQGIDPARMLQQQQGIASSSMGYGTPQYQQQQHQATIGSPLNLFQSPAPTSATPSAKSLVKDYYTHIYRFVPVLPDPKFIDALTNCIQPGSPLLLSLQCVIPILRDQPLLPQQQPYPTPEARKDAIRAEALFYAKQAYDAIDEVLERVEQEQEQDKEDASILEVIQALCILVIYEYGSGRALKSRLKVDAALTLAMSKGLHRLSSSSSRSISAADTVSNGRQRLHYLTQLPDDEVYEVKKRTWWNLWMLAMWTAYNTGRIPTVRADDSRVTSELPSSPNGNLNLWPNVISSLQGLLLVQDRVLSLAHIEHGRMPANGLRDPSIFGSDGNQQNGNGGRNAEIPQTFSGQPTLSSRDEILHSMVELDENIQKKMQELEQTTYGIVGPSEGMPTHNANEDETQRILKFLWAIQLYTTSLTLHIGQAFHGASLFERKLCFLSSISESTSDPATCQVPMPNAFEETDFSSATGVNPVSMAPMMDLYARGPFKPRESLRRCVDASDKLLSISRNLRKSEGHMASPNPFNACSFVLISFVCLMQALAISTSSMQEEDPMLGSNLDGTNDDGALGQNSASQGSTSTSTLLRTAQSAAALTPAVGQAGSTTNGGIGSPTSFFQGSSDVRPSQQAQLQNIWARVKEARDALQGLSKYWDMVIPMREEVTGCLQASQFLLSQHPEPEQTIPPPFSM